MWQRQYSKTYKHVDVDKIWQLWSDIDNWPSWHDDLEYCKLDGEFAEGNYFRLKPKGAPAVKIKLCQIEPKRRFTDCTRFIGARMYDTHEVEVVHDGVRLTNTLVVKGLLSRLWIKLVAQNVADTVPNEMDTLAKLASKTDG